MVRRPLLLAVAACLVAAAPLAAVQVEPRVVYSPLNNKPFRIVDIPVTSNLRDQLGAEGAPDMGTDDDGCRHSSGVNEYEHYIATCPYTYFTALTVEWRPDGRFGTTLEPDFKQWVTSPEGFHGEWVTDKDRLYDRAQRAARAQRKQIPPISEWVIPQQMIPLEKRYRLALRSYQRRGVTEAFQAKLALNGAWALRVELNRPLLDQRLRAGIEEVNQRLEPYLEDSKTFDLDRVYDAYRTIFTGRRLTDEGYFVAGTAYMGFALRKGDLAEATGILDDLLARFDDKGNDQHIFFRGLIRDRQQSIRDYTGFLQLAATHFRNAIAAEEIPRPKLPEILLAVAECHRRMGAEVRALDWYLALANLDETHPRMREEIRQEKRYPTMDAPYALLLGWRADQYVEQLREKGVVHPGTIAGPDAKLLNAVLNEGLGTLAYESPTWAPHTGGTQLETARILNDVGKAILDYVNRAGRWPQRLGDLWIDGLIPNRNVYNRFHCPVTGEPLRYEPIGGPLDGLPADMVLIATPLPVPTNQGPRYGLFTANLQVHWSEQQVEPGKRFQP